MSKKSRKNPSKPAAGKVTKRAAKPAAKTPAKAPAKAAAKSPAKKVAAKPAKPATKAVSKTVAKTVGKAAAKVSKAPVTKKAPAARKTVVKAAPKKEPKATDKAAAKSAVQSTPKPAAPPKPSPEKPKPAPEKKVAPEAPSFAAEGARAPAFQLPRDGGATVSLSDYAGQKVVIFFYPRASTPGCTKEAIDFTRLSGDFQAAGAALLGVSADPLKAQESFRDKHDLAMPLLSDATQAMLKSYGAWGEKSMYGKVFEGVLRTTVLINGDGNVARIWHGVKVDGHADEVLEEARRI